MRDRSFDVAMRFYLRQLERQDLQPHVRKNYLDIAQNILDSHIDTKGYSRYEFLLNRYKPRSGLDG